MDLLFLSGDHVSFFSQVVMAVSRTSQNFKVNSPESETFTPDVPLISQDLLRIVAAADPNVQGFSKAHMPLSRLSDGQRGWWRVLFEHLKFCWWMIFMAPQRNHFPYVSIIFRLHDCRRMILPVSFSTLPYFPTEKVIC